MNLEKRADLVNTWNKRCAASPSPVAQLRCFTEILFGPGLPHRGGHSTMPLPLRAWEELMAKGQMRSSKEKKKPKADKDKPKQLSAYKQAQTGGGSAALSAPKKA